MILYSMTATFGKLEHQTLTLEPGLNIIHAPNEWGKSTWCAFLLAMLYGMDTKAKATRTTLPEKERYAPWSGSPMSGRIELNWNGRDITLERSTKGRVPLGSFRAYETESGLPVPELTAANCGAVLLGVERSVFQRAGFIRQADLPVTQDEDLRRRLNALVTTGDESGDAARLEKGLKDLKNRCRYNRSGLLPQAMEERQGLEDTLTELGELQNRLKQTEAELEENAALRQSLENHRAALAYARARRDAQRVTQGEETLAAAQAKAAELEARCSRLPAPEELEKRRSALWEHRQQLEQLPSLPPPPQPPQIPEPFLGMSPAQALRQAREDGKRCRRPLWSWGLLVLGLLCLLGAGVLLYLQKSIPGIAAGGIGALSLILGLAMSLAYGKRRRALYDRYGSREPEGWEAMAQSYADEQEDYARRQREDAESRERLAARRHALKEAHRSLCGEKSLESCFAELEENRRLYERLESARLEKNRAARELEGLRAMAHSAPAPAFPDERTESPEQTEALLRQLEKEDDHLRGRLGQYRGRMEALGREDALLTRLEQVSRRIRELERYDAALTLAQQTLVQAREELQRRFAPKITRGAQELLSALTLGRYDRLQLESDFSLLAGAQEENVLRSARWRSDGTADQLYLALRLSVARELTPEAPLILDDAFVRFDEERLQAALAVLEDYARTHQVLVFTCRKFP